MAIIRSKIARQLLAEGGAPRMLKHLQEGEFLAINQKKHRW